MDDIQRKIQLTELALQELYLARDERIRGLIAAGLPLREIGKRYNVTRQRIQQIKTSK